MDNENIVTFAPKQKVQAGAYMDMEPEVHDLVRIADLALHVWLVELDGDEITDNGSPLQLLLEDIQQRAKKLRSRYRDDSGDNGNAA